MKVLLTTFICFSLTSYAQKFALLDREFKKPVIFSDTVTADILNQKQFPIFSNDLDTLIKGVDWWIAHLSDTEKKENRTDDFVAGNSWFIGQTERRGHNMRYRIILNTRAGDIGSSIELVMDDDSNKKAFQRLSVFKDYLRNNKVLVQEAVSKAVMHQ